MEIDKIIAQTIFCLKESFKIEGDKFSTIADKMFVTGFIDFLKSDVLPQNERHLAIFDEFKINPTNLKVEGKFELALEEGLDINSSKKPKLIEKIEQLQEYFEQRKNNIHENNVTIQEDEQTEDDEFDEFDQNGEAVISSSFVEKEEGLTLVPWDFSEKSEQAFHHAVNYVKIIGGEISLVHIVKTDIEARAVVKKLKTTVEKLETKYQLRPSYLIKTGSIFSAISDVATHSKAKLIVMGTHGMKGMQKITGSWALKVIIDSKPPFVVVQDSPQTDKVEKILFPVDKSKETRQKIKMAEWFSKRNPNAIFQICRIGKTPNDYIERMINTNTNYVKSYFRQVGVRHEVIMLDGSNLADSILNFIERKQVDLIMILTTQNINITNYMIGLDEQKIIFNKMKVPVMCINPLKAKYASVNGFGASQ